MTEPSSSVTRRRMRNSRLVGVTADAPEEVVRRYGAMQAQDYGPAKWSVAQRGAGHSDGDLDRALAFGSIVRTHVLRPTWHFVAREDVRWLLALTGPRVHRHNHPRYRELGLDDRTRHRCERALAAALEGGNRLTRHEVAGVLDLVGIDRSGQRLAYILMHCELEAVICSGGLIDKQQSYALLDERVPDDHRFDRDERLVELARRYLTSHGPATVQDLGWWSSMTVADVNKALELLGPEVRRETIDGITFWSMASNLVRPPSARGAHFLQSYDELVVGYTQSRFFGDPRAGAARAARRDRSLPTGVVLLNGLIFGHWRRTIDKGIARVEVLAYEDWTPGEARVLRAAAGDLGRFLGREVSVEMRRI